MMSAFLFLWCFLFSMDVQAQEMAPAVRQGTRTVGALEQWQSGVDAIRSQMEVLIRQNDQLTRTYDQDKVQEAHLLKMIDEQRKKVDALNDFLKQRAGKTDQQLHMDALSDQLSIKRLQLNKVLLDYKTKHAQVENVQQRLEDKRRRVSAYELEQGDGASKKTKDIKVDPALEQLRKDLEKQKASEGRLISQMDPSKMTGNSYDLGPLQDKLIALQNQKAALLRKPLVSASPDKDKFYLMQAKKEELEVKIRSFERRIDVLKSSSEFSGSWSASRKQMVRDIVLGDTRNKRLANAIKDLREDIILLRTQIGVLEKRVLFSTNNKY